MIGWVSKARIPAMTSTRALAVASLFLALAGCQTAPDPAAKPKVAAMLPGTWGSDGPDYLGLTFRDDGTFTAAENPDIKNISPFGPYDGTYRWVDDQTLNLTYRGGAKSPAPPA